MSLAWFLPMPGSYAGVDVVGVYNFACSLREVLAKHPFLPHGCGLFSGSYFPSFSEGLSLRGLHCRLRSDGERDFPSFSEGLSLRAIRAKPFSWARHFPSFSEGLSLRVWEGRAQGSASGRFPFLFGGTFIEGLKVIFSCVPNRAFPFLFGGTFIEGQRTVRTAMRKSPFPFLFGGTFIEGHLCVRRERSREISLPFRRDFH